jgi:hypothetical protein
MKITKHLKTALKHIFEKIRGNTVIAEKRDALNSGLAGLQKAETMPVNRRT